MKNDSDHSHLSVTLKVNGHEHFESVRDRILAAANVVSHGMYTDPETESVSWPSQLMVVSSLAIGCRCSDILVSVQST